MKLGAFSISLAVKNIKASKQFYQKLGFSVVAGDEEHHYLIMKNEDHSIGLFEGMFEENLMTFNPGWDKDCNTLEEYHDIRAIYQHCKEQSIEIAHEEMSSKSGPAHFAIKDPDGNTILIDQHV